MSDYKVERIDQKCSDYYDKLIKIKNTVAKYVNLFSKYDANTYSANIRNLTAALNNTKNTKLFSELKKTSNIPSNNVAASSNDIENNRLIYLDLTKVLATLSKYIALFRNCDHGDYNDLIIQFTAALNNEKIYQVLSGLKDKSTTVPSGGNLKSNDIYISNNMKKKIMMKDGSTKLRTIYHKKGNKKQTIYVKINSEYVKYNSKKKY